MEGLVANVTATCPLSFSGTTGYIFAKAVAAVVTAHCAFFDDYQWPKDKAQEIINSGTRSFDFIIVGAGTAGSSLAGQLADFHPGLSVLLIEAGDDPPLNSEVPAFFFQNQDIDWEYNATADGACLGFNDNVCTWNKGMAMGGSSSINAMLYVRGHPKDYQNWKELANTGWGYDDLLPYFNRIEKRINLSSHKYNDNPWYTILRNAYKECGVQADTTNNNEGTMGTKIINLMIQNGKRHNTAKVHLRDINNLHIIKNSKAQKVIVDRVSKIAIGVELRHKSGVVMQMKANKEVILSAGSIATPQILMLSGIGPKSHIQETGIESLIDLPVGKNLQDHVIFPLFFKTNQKTEISAEMLILSMIQYMLTKSGPLSNLGITDFMAFVDTKNVSDHPDVQYHHMYFTKNDNFLKLYLGRQGYRNEIITAIEQLNAENDLLAVYPTLLHPKSRGEVLLHDSNISVKPKIKANYFNDPDDIATLIGAIKFVRKLERTEQMKLFEIEMMPLNLSGCERSPAYTEEYWECYIRHMATTVYHPVGTAKIGTEGDDGAVVDNDLLIHGMSNLRVVDASVMPTIPGGNTMAPTLVIAEKAFEIITRKYFYKDEL